MEKKENNKKGAKISIGHWSLSVTFNWIDFYAINFIGGREKGRVVSRELRGLDREQEEEGERPKMITRQNPIELHNGNGEMVIGLLGVQQNVWTMYGLIVQW